MKEKDYHEFDAQDAAYKSILMQNHRLRVQLMLERKGISTLNMSLKSLQYINDGFKVGMMPDQLANGLETLIPIWEKENEASSFQRKAIYRAG